MAKLSTCCQIYCFLLFLTALLSQKCCTDGIVIYERNLFNDLYSRVLKYSKAKFLQNVFYSQKFCTVVSDLSTLLQRSGHLCRFLHF